MSVPINLDAFCHQQYARLVGTLTLFCGDSEVAREMAQEALARACADWNKVRRMEAPGAWVNRVALNLARSHFRRKAAEKRAVARLGSFASQQTLDPEHDEAIQMRRAIAALPVRQRTALILRYYLGMSVLETADVMGCPDGTVKRLTHRAIARLRRNLHVNDIREVSDAS
jgi:RNA polymerase sigma-70 factor (ECF subfamily)